mgnify:CR=1 FL=1
MGDLFFVVDESRGQWISISGDKDHTNINDKRNVHRAINEEHARDTSCRVGRPEPDTEGHCERRPDDARRDPQIPGDLPVRRRGAHPEGPRRVHFIFVDFRWSIMILLALAGLASRRLDLGHPLLQSIKTKNLPL